MRLHEWIADGCDAVQDVLSGRGRWAGQRAYEVDVCIGALDALIDALEAEDHGGYFRIRSKLLRV